MLRQPRLRRPDALLLATHTSIPPPAKGIAQQYQRSSPASTPQDVKFDAEGGAEANSPKTRYLATGISVLLELASAHADDDARAGDVGGNTSNGVAGGAGGFKLIGMAMGTYGASMSVYSHFLARGRDLVFPKNTAMEVAIGPRPSGPSPNSRKPTDLKFLNPHPKIEN